MSYTFSVPLTHSPRFSEVLNACPNLSSGSDEVFEDDLFPPEYFFHFYRHGVSVRSLEVSYHNRNEYRSTPSFEVRIMTASCAEDYEIALCLVEAVAKAFNSTIKGEDADPCSADALRMRFDADWINRMVRSGATFLRTMVKSDDYSGPFTISGTVRPYYFGERTLAKIDCENEDEYVDAYYAYARKVQYITDKDFGGYYSATRMTMEMDGEQSLFSLWGPSDAYVYSDVPYLLPIYAKDDQMIPISALETLIPDRVSWLDDRQRCVEAIPESEWEEIMEAAKSFYITPSSKD